jgi:hypothetical protein
MPQARDAGLERLKQHEAPPNAISSSSILESKFSPPWLWARAFHLKHASDDFMPHAVIELPPRDSYRPSVKL